MERIKTTFGFSSTVDEVLQGIDLTGKRAIVTGGSSGIGIETARALQVWAPKSRWRSAGWMLEKELLRTFGHRLAIRMFGSASST